MGTFLTYRLAGGEAGMRHFMAQFGPALALPWTRLTEVPELDDELVERIVSQSDAQAQGRTVAELIETRDDCLVAVLLALKGENFAAGAEIARQERRLLDLETARDLGADADDGWLHVHQAAVVPEWIDYNGHMTEFRYLEVLADATDAVLRRIGIDSAYIAQRGSYYTVETHIRHLAEARSGERIDVATRLLGHDDKRLHLYHEARTDRGVASGEHLLLHIDAQTGRVGRAPAEVMEALRRIAEQQQDLPWPEAAGRRIESARLGSTLG
jgi:carnitine 3-dehydrogenase